MKPIEEQVIVYWIDPGKKQPKIGETVVATVSGSGVGQIYDHALLNVRWCGENYGWEMADVCLDEFIVHRWCDLEPYGG